MSPAGTGLSRAAPQSWIVHREMAVLLGWPRAILLQLAHPLVAQGVADHSAFTAERLGRYLRLRRTLDAMLTLTFGTEAEAHAVAARINGIHDRVCGRLPAASGRLPGGTPYTAHDPQLLLWVHATCLESFMLAYERFVRPLARDERDRYCDEAAEGGKLFGIPDALLPRTASGLARYMRDTVADGPIAVGDTARRLAHDVLHPASALVLGPALWGLRHVTVGLLPPAIRAAYGFAWSERREAALGVAAHAARAVVPRLPALVRCWPRARRAFARERLAA